MRVGFPVEIDEGIDSRVYGHFGSAPCFIIIEPDGSDVTTVNNRDAHHEHGACNPIKALDGHDVDAVVVGGIGAGALNGLNAQGIRVYGAIADTVKENYDLLRDGKLPELALQHSCGGHGGCGHHH